MAFFYVHARGAIKQNGKYEPVTMSPGKDKNTFIKLYDNVKKAIDKVGGIKCEKSADARIEFYDHESRTIVAVFYCSAEVLKEFKWKPITRPVVHLA